MLDSVSKQIIDKFVASMLLVEAKSLVLATDGVIYQHTLKNPSQSSKIKNQGKESAKLKKNKTIPLYNHEQLEYLLNLLQVNGIECHLTSEQPISLVKEILDKHNLLHLISSIRTVFGLEQQSDVEETRLIDQLLSEKGTLIYICQSARQRRFLETRLSDPQYKNRLIPFAGGADFLDYEELLERNSGDHSLTESQAGFVGRAINSAANYIIRVGLGFDIESVRQEQDLGQIPNYKNKKLPELSPITTTQGETYQPRRRILKFLSRNRVRQSNTASAVQIEVYPDSIAGEVTPPIQTKGQETEEFGFPKDPEFPAMADPSSPAKSNSTSTPSRPNSLANLLGGDTKSNIFDQDEGRQKRESSGPKSGLRVPSRHLGASTGSGYLTSPPRSSEVKQQIPAGLLEEKEPIIEPQVTKTIPSIKFRTDRKSAFNVLSNQDSEINPEREERAKRFRRTLVKKRVRFQIDHGDSSNSDEIALLEDKNEVSQLTLYLEVEQSVPNRKIILDRSVHVLSTLFPENIIDESKDRIVLELVHGNNINEFHINKRHQIRKGYFLFDGEMRLMDLEPDSIPPEYLEFYKKHASNALKKLPEKMKMICIELEGLNCASLESPQCFSISGSKGKQITIKFDGQQIEFKRSQEEGFYQPEVEEILAIHSFLNKHLEKRKDYYMSGLKTYSEQNLKSDILPIREDSWTINPDPSKSVIKPKARPANHQTESQSIKV